MKKVTVVLSKEAEEVFRYLNLESKDSKFESVILRALQQKFELIKDNPRYGNPISKKLFPKKFIEKYEITNLFRVELPNYWRMLYTLVDGEDKVEVVSFVLTITNHDKYNKLFGYGGK